MDECIFCKIVKGEIPCAEVYSTDDIICFLDIAPASAGHTLVVPKKHYSNLWEIPEDLGKELLRVMKIVGEAVLKATNATGLNVLMNNHPSAGQVVPHAHIHLIPRHEQDGLLRLSQKEYESEEIMNKLVQKIRSII